MAKSTVEIIEGYISSDLIKGFTFEAISRGSNDAPEIIESTLNQYIKSEILIKKYEITCNGCMSIISTKAEKPEDLKELKCLRCSRYKEDGFQMNAVYNINRNNLNIQAQASLNLSENNYKAKLQ